MIRNATSYLFLLLFTLSSISVSASNWNYTSTVEDERVYEKTVKSYFPNLKNLAKINVVFSEIADVDKDGEVIIEVFDNNIGQVVIEEVVDYTQLIDEKSVEIIVSDYDISIANDFKVLIHYKLTDNAQLSIKEEVDLTFNEVVTNVREEIANESGFFGFDIYPNPATDYISFRFFGNMNGGVVSIYNIIGERVRVFQPRDNEYIDISDLELGMYYVHITDGVNKATKTLRVN